MIMKKGVAQITDAVIAIGIFPDFFCNNYNPSQ